MSAGTQRESHEGVAVVTPRGETVLVVDDDSAVRQVASKVLRRDGYDVIEAGGADEALEIADARAGAIDLLLTDVVMPGMGGRELSETLRERHPDVPVLFMSAYTEDDVLLRGIQVEEVDFIQKPFTVSALRERVRKVLDAARR